MTPVVTPSRPTPYLYQLAARAIREGLGSDLARWPARDKLRVLCAALDAEHGGDVAVECAAQDAGRKIVQERARRVRGD